MLHIGRRAHLRLGLVLEVHLQGLDLLVPASRLVGGILQRTDFGLGVPLQLCCNYLRICSVFVFFLFVVICWCESVRFRCDSFRS